MEYSTLTYLLFPIITIFIIHHLLNTSPKTKLPPGPKPWPIIGNLHLLGSNPHRSTAELSKTYGPLMTLKLGRLTTIVISSSEVAKEMFLKHDLAFSSRHIPDASRSGDHEKLSLVWLPVGPKWRDLRRILATQLFSNHQLENSQELRKNKVDELVEFAKGCCENGRAVEIGKAGFITSLNLLLNTVFSMNVFSYESSASRELRDLVWSLIEAAAKPNVSDFFPVFRPLDLQGARRRNSVTFYKMMGFFERIIDARMRDEVGANDDVLGTLLKLVQKNEITLDDVKHLLVDLFIAGTETTSNTLEWAMTELVRHPEKMVKAQDEIDQVLGKSQSKSVQESDISDLHYIQAIVKETLRLHPPAPFFVPHKANENVQFHGYIVPENAQIWVNAWCIGRDPSIWPNPESFGPERFLGSEIDFRGHHFELIPFGAGRRMCPGIPVAYRMVHLMLATLLHSFDWKLDHGLTPEDVDVEEKFGVTLLKAQPLQLIPLPKKLFCFKCLMNPQSNNA